MEYTLLHRFLCISEESLTHLVAVINTLYACCAAAMLSMWMAASDIVAVQPGRSFLLSFYLKRGMAHMFHFHFAHTQRFNFRVFQQDMIKGSLFVWTLSKAWIGQFKLDSYPGNKSAQICSICWHKTGFFFYKLMQYDIQYFKVSSLTLLNKTT